MNRIVDCHGRMYVERDWCGGEERKLVCTKESHAEKVERAEQAKTVLPQVQAIFTQVLDPAGRLCCTCNLQSEVLQLGIYADLLVLTSQMA